MDFGEREQPLLCIYLVPKIYCLDGSSMLDIHNLKVGFFDPAIRQGPAKEGMGKRKARGAMKISLL